VLFVLFILMSVSGPLQGDPQQAWSWFLPSCVPTLSLVIGVYVTESRQTPGEDRQLDPFLFQVAAGVSIFYLAVILFTLLLMPLAAAPDKSAAYLKMANLWVAPVQGLAAAALGAFFVRQGKSSEEGADAGDRLPETNEGGAA
jgi:hypothetical protein